MSNINILDEADEMDVALMCLEENIDEELETIESNIDSVYDGEDDNIGEELYSIYVDPNTIEPDDSDVSFDGMDAEDDMDADVEMVVDEDEEIMDTIESEF